MASEPRRFRNLPRGVRLAIGVVVGLLLLAAIGLGPAWVLVWWTGLDPSTRRVLSIGFLNTSLVAYGGFLLSAIMAGFLAMMRLLQGRRLKQKRLRSARVLLLSSTLLIAFGMAEFGAWALAVQARRPPPIPPVPRARVTLANGAPDEINVLVIGESTAEGQPFHPWFSIGHVIAWQLEKANPGRKVNLKMDGHGGICLTTVIQLLEQQTVRPDVVILYCGHNEFQGRFGWGRTVNYYPEDQRQRPKQGLADRVGDLTPFVTLIHSAVDRQKIDLPPTVKDSREVIDRPVCSIEGRRDIRTIFSRQLETITAWCENAGAVPIYFVPAGNDVGFDPDRSMLDPSTRLDAREAFATKFLEAREIESSDPKVATALYRDMIARQPMYSEAHFRLAQLVLAEGQVKEADREFATARDLDGLPMRCPSEIQEVYREIAENHKSVVLVEAPTVLRRLSPSGLLDDNCFHDGQHPSFRSYVALSQEALDLLRNRGLLGFKTANLPPVDPAECASKFELDTPERWAAACRRAASFWGRLANSRYDPSERKTRADRLDRAAEMIEKGTKPEDTGVPGLGVRPKGFP